MRSYGVVPWFEQARRLPAEDVLGLEERSSSGTGAIRIAVPRLPRAANFDDLDPLARRAGRGASHRARRASRCRGMPTS